MCSTDIFLGVLALLFPPLPVWVKCGICSADSVINILLCVLGFLPGLLHAWYIIAKHPEPSWEYEAVPDSEEQQDRDRVTYVFVRDDGHRCEHSSRSYHARNPRYNSNGPAQPKRQGQQQPQRPGAYGTQQGSSAQQQQQQEQGVTGGAGPSSGGQAPEDGSVPPSYAEAVGDNKVQRGE